jgi:hypothetical protein
LSPSVGPAVRNISLLSKRIFSRDVGTIRTSNVTLIIYSEDILIEIRERYQSFDMHRDISFLIKFRVLFYYAPERSGIYSFWHVHASICVCLILATSCKWLVTGLSYFTCMLLVTRPIYLDLNFLFCDVEFWLWWW